jgi:hypothetical protein
MTNFDSVAGIAGDDETEAWPGTRIELYPTKTQMGGRVVDCIRIRATRVAELDDEEVPTEISLRHRLRTGPAKTVRSNYEVPNAKA